MVVGIAYYIHVGLHVCMYVLCIVDVCTGTMYTWTEKTRFLKPSSVGTSFLQQKKALTKAA